MLEFVLILVPVVLFAWIVLTVTALHKREVYFWSLGSTWASVIACPLAISVICIGQLTNLNDSNASISMAPVVGGVILYLAAFAYATHYNLKATKSPRLALSTSMLQQLAVLGMIFLFLRWRGEEVNRGRGR